MKKKTTLNKLRVSSFVTSKKEINTKTIKGGDLTSVVTCGHCTAGCSDGCSPLQTAWNCTLADCSADCPDLK